MATRGKLVRRLFTQDTSARNVKAYLAIKRAKLDLRLPLPAPSAR